MTDFIPPERVCELIPGMTKANLASLRFKGQGPKFYKPTPRTVVYRESEVIAWVEESVRVTS